VTGKGISAGGGGEGGVAVTIPIHSIWRVLAALQGLGMPWDMNMNYENRSRRF